MSKAFEKHKDRRISEISERIRYYRLKKKLEMKTLGKHVKKAWKKCQWIENKLKEVIKYYSIILNFFIW